MNVSLTTLILVLLNCLVSYKGLKDEAFMQRWAFKVERIRIHKEYDRFFTSSFLHVSWSHLFFNVLTLMLFGQQLEAMQGVWLLLATYLIGMLGGDLLSYAFHYQHGWYSAVGASGAVNGLVFSCIVLSPFADIQMLLLPIPVPFWLYGFLYLAYTLLGLRSQSDRIGHDAHLGGLLAAVLFTLVVSPRLGATQVGVGILIVVASGIFLYFVFTKPQFMYLADPFAKYKGFHTQDDRYNAGKLEKERELDVLLDKIHKNGLESLSQKEKDRLDKLSQQ